MRPNRSDIEDWTRAFTHKTKRERRAWAKAMPRHELEAVALLLADLFLDSLTAGEKALRIASRAERKADAVYNAVHRLTKPWSRIDEVLFKWLDP